MNKPLKSLIKLVEKLTKGNSILKISIYTILILIPFLILISVFIN
jgi:hypothetical protein